MTLSQFESALLDRIAGNKAAIDKALHDAWVGLVAKGLIVDTKDTPVLTYKGLTVWDELRGIVTVAAE